MISITLTYVSVTETMEIVNELRSLNMLQGQDWDFSYNQSKWDEMIGEIPRHTVFTFYTEGLASWFKLKYTK